MWSALGMIICRIRSISSLILSVAEKLVAIQVGEKISLMCHVSSYAIVDGQKTSHQIICEYAFVVNLDCGLRVETECRRSPCGHLYFF